MTTPAMNQPMLLPTQALADAVLYALRCGCLFPVPEPSLEASVQEWVQWGAMRHLHDEIAKASR